MSDNLYNSKLVNKVSKIVKHAAYILKKPVENIKSSSYNPSTNLDIEVSNFLSKSLKELVNAHVISEEDFVSKEKYDNLSWVIDPIDGTINFINNAPDFAISVALVDQNFKALIAVIYLPYFDEMYTAVKGEGANINDKEILLKKIDYNIVSYGLPNDSKMRFIEISNDIKNLVQQGYILRQTGSASIDICRVANGVWKSFFEKGLYIWDIAAADLIAKESGCFSFTQIINKQLECNYLVSNSMDMYNDLLIILGMRE